MITQAEAKIEAARGVLWIVERSTIDLSTEALSTEDVRLVAEEIRNIKTWLRRRALGGSPAVGGADRPWDDGEGQVEGS